MKEFITANISVIIANLRNFNQQAFWYQALKEWNNSFGAFFVKPS